MEGKPAIGITLFLSYLVLVINGDPAEPNQDENIGSILIHRYVNKTIQAEDGDVYDCIDINRQPALNHPLLKGHIIQMKPSSYPSGLDIQSELPPNISQAQLPNIECPGGTIPILRKIKVHKEVTMPLLNIGTMDDKQGEKAAIRYWDDNHGTRAAINIFEPLMTRTNGDLSASWAQINNGLEAIGAGSMIWPSYSGDNFARLHVHWVDSANKPCYDLDCPGFVQVDPNAGIGGRMQSVSTYNGPQYQYDVIFFQDWWFAVGDKNVPVGYRPIGYWPSSLFSAMKDKAHFCFWGGLVRGPTASTDPPLMGSGHFAAEGFGKAAFVRDIKVVDGSNKFVNPNAGKARPGSSRQQCYTVDGFGVNDGGMHTFYGGPGHCRD
ncbi:protein neprosin-like [Phragmites australis]|uniref:protein neprosin-like n=1 Tax=Phragmites australis TaxID=29695 RepID=UPI002D773F36|nr:protein neprosin-like [Phragmites australis]